VAETVGEGSQRTRAQISTTASLTLSHSFARSLSLTISSYNIILSLTTMRVWRIRANEYEFLQCSAQGPLEQRYTTAVIVFYSRALTCHATSTNTTVNHVLLFTTAPLSPTPNNDTESQRSSTLQNQKLPFSRTPP